MSDDRAATASRQRADILFDQGRYPEAEKHFREALFHEPNDPELLARLAVCELAQDRPEPALATLDRAVGVEPEFAHLHALRAYALAELARFTEAFRATEQALALDPSSDDAFAAQAVIHLRQQKWDRAEGAARAALALNPDHAGAANSLAHALRLQGRLAESGEHIATMLAQDPEDADTHAAAGWIALQRGERVDAERHLLEALRLDPTNESAREGLKEAFRARAFFYRAYLKYCFFLQRFTTGRQWVFFIGLILVVKFSALVLGPLAALVIVPYLVFVLWLHVARPVGNLRLLFDRVARHALTRNEAVEAVVSGGAVVIGGLLLVGAVAGMGEAAAFAGITCLGAAFPLAYVFTNRSAGRWFFAGVAALIVIAGVLTVVEVLTGAEIPGQNALIGTAALALILTTWVSNLDVMNRR